MNKTQISVKIVADSINQQGDRIISALLTFPRIILSEFNKHRMLSSNTSSSRAIPFLKMVEVVQNDPFIPYHFQEKHSGMQGTEYLNGIEYENAVDNWLIARNAAIENAEILHSCNVTKQLCNRLLEPFMWCTVLATGNLKSWNHLFELRCPVYEIDDNVFGLRQFKSKKDAKMYCDMNGIHNYPHTDLDWFKLNKGQAEIHFMNLAEKMYDAVNESVPKLLQPGDWHLPMLPEKALHCKLEDKLKWCVGIHANTSYTVVGDDKELTLEHASKIHDKCKNEHHSSVFEHCARVMTDNERNIFVKGEFKHKKTDTGSYFNNSELGWCYNLKGFIPYRYFIDNNINL